MIPERIIFVSRGITVLTSVLLHKTAGLETIPMLGHDEYTGCLQYVMIIIIAIVFPPGGRGIFFFSYLQIKAQWQI